MTTSLDLIKDTNNVPIHLINFDTKSFVRNITRSDTKAKAEKLGACRSDSSMGTRRIALPINHFRVERVLKINYRDWSPSGGGGAKK